MAEQAQIRKVYFCVRPDFRGDFEQADTGRYWMPFEGAIAYVTDGTQYGIAYETGNIDWFGPDLEFAFGDGTEIDEIGEVLDMEAVAAAYDAKLLAQEDEAEEGDDD